MQGVGGWPPVSLVALATPALAHYAVQSAFDVSGKQQKWEGTLKVVRWVNPPHSGEILFDDPNAN